MCAFISVWVAACTDTPPAAPENLATNELSATLIVRTPGPLIPTLAPGLPVILTTSPEQTTSTASPTLLSTDIRDWPYPLIASPTPVLLNLPQPTCYDTPQGGILCLGYIQNTQTYPVKNAVLAVELFNAEGEILYIQETAIEQHHIPANEMAPYRAYFEPLDTLPLAGDFGSVQARIIRAEEDPTVSNQAIEIQSDTGDLVGEQYHISLDLHNTQEETQHDIRVVATLYDNDNHVMGYHIVEIATLAGYAVYPLTMSIIPAATHIPLHYTLFVEYQN